MDEPTVLRQEIERLISQRDRYADKCDDALAEVTRLREALEALTKLVNLKDGPRGGAYVAAKYLAWSEARRILAALAEGSDVLPTGGAEHG